jgi:hypothetical protein
MKAVTGCTRWAELFVIESISPSGFTQKKPGFLIEVKEAAVNPFLSIRF